MLELFSICVTFLSDNDKISKIQFSSQKCGKIVIPSSKGYIQISIHPEADSERKLQIGDYFGM
jgi:hypothetical protein